MSVSATDALSHLANIPQELRDRDQWLVWRREARLGGDVTKVPYIAAPGRHKASSTDPRTWASFADACNTWRAHLSLYDGIGFVLSSADDYVGVDLDHCVEGESLAEWCIPILASLRSYTEVSPSGTGLRIFVRGSLPVGGRKKGPIEMYSEGRYLTMTGWVVRPASAPDEQPRIEERTAELAALHRATFGEPSLPPPPRTPSLPATADDFELLRRASDALNGPRFAALFRGEWKGTHRSQSEADMALCAHLLYWCQGDAARADRLFRQSGLYREQWDERHTADGRTYGQLTMGKAQLGQPSVGACPEGPAFMDNGGRTAIEDFFDGY